MEQSQLPLTVISEHDAGDGTHGSALTSDSLMVMPLGGTGVLSIVVLVSVSVDRRLTV